MKYMPEKSKIIPNNIPTNCIFCGAKSHLTNEHVTPKYLGRLLRTSVPNHEFRKTVIDPKGSHLVAERRSGDPVSRRVKCVCGDCNGGWMKDLVDQSKPIVERLVKGEKCRISPEEQKVIAAWISIAVIVSELDRKGEVTIPPDQRDRLWKTGQAPERWKIWIGDYERSKPDSYWIHCRLPITNDKSTLKGTEGPANTQTTTYALGRLFVYAISSEVLGEGLDLEFQGRNASMLWKIWPTNANYSFLWPPPTTMNDEDFNRIGKSIIEAALSTHRMPPLNEIIS